MQPSRLETAIRWLLLVGFVITSGMGSARSNCCCITPLTAASCCKEVVATEEKSCCKNCESEQCDTSKCAESEDGCGVDCGCSVSAATQVVYKEPESTVSKVFVAENRLEIVDPEVFASMESTQRNDLLPVLSAQQECSLMCSWQK